MPKTSSTSPSSSEAKGKKALKPASAAAAGDSARGQGGELQQQAGGDHPVLTTQQGIPVADNQNSLCLLYTSPSPRDS